MIERGFVRKIPRERSKLVATCIELVMFHDQCDDDELHFPWM